MTWYAHAIPQNDHDAAEMLGGLLAEKGKEDTESETAEEPTKPSNVTSKVAPTETQSKVTAKSRQTGKGSIKEAGQLIRLVS